MNPYTHNALGPDVHEILFEGRHIGRFDFVGVRSSQHTLIAAMVAGLNADYRSRRGDGGQPDRTANATKAAPVPVRHPAHREIPNSVDDVGERRFERGPLQAQRAYLESVAEREAAGVS